MLFFTWFVENTSKDVRDNPKYILLVSAVIKSLLSKDLKCMRNGYGLTTKTERMNLAVLMPAILTVA